MRREANAAPQTMEATFGGQHSFYKIFGSEHSWKKPCHRWELPISIKHNRRKSSSRPLGRLLPIPANYLNNNSGTFLIFTVKLFFCFKYFWKTLLVFLENIFEKNVRLYSWYFFLFLKNIFTFFGKSFWFIIIFFQFLYKI